MKEFAAQTFRWLTSIVFALSFSISAGWLLSSLFLACGYGESALAGGVVVAGCGVAACAGLAGMLGLTDTEGE